MIVSKVENKVLYKYGKLIKNNFSPYQRMILPNLLSSVPDF